MEYSRELAAATDAATSAGILLRDEFSRPGGPRGAGGHADADDAAEALIREHLLGAFPRDGYLGEETGAAAGAAGARRTWVVDPNDGTSSFLKGRRGPAVSIALLDDGIPVLGVVYAYAAPDHGGDLICWAEGGPIIRNGDAITPRQWPSNLDGSVVVGLSSGAQSAPSDNAALLCGARFLPVPGIAYRLALAAAGDIDAAISTNGPVSWDYAAGHALLRGAGGALSDLEGRPVLYGSDGWGSVRGCIGGGRELVTTLGTRPWASATFRPVAKEYLDLVELERGRCITGPRLLQRAQGALLGQLCGDALGSLVEFQSAGYIAQQYPDGPRTMHDGGTWGTLAGQPTDDSELALSLARSIVTEGGWSEDAVATAYHSWYESDPFDIGGTTRQALSGLSPGPGAAEAARRAASGTSQSNGSLMRASPLGIYGHQMPEKLLVELAREDSRLTHPHPICCDACAVYVVTIARALRTQASPKECFDHALAFAKTQDMNADLIEALETAPLQPPADFEAQQGWVLIALQNAFYRLLHAETLEDGVVQTVRAGGDTDTNAAIAGALLGATHGRDAIPRAWRRSVLTCRPMPPPEVGSLVAKARHPRPRAFWPVDALELAERLVYLGMEEASQDEPDLIGRPAGKTTDP